MVLLAESGIVYCISSVSNQSPCNDTHVDYQFQIILVVAQGIRTPLGGTVGDIYTPMHVQLAVSRLTMVQ